MRARARDKVGLLLQQEADQQVLIPDIKAGVSSVTGQ